MSGDTVFAPRDLYTDLSDRYAAEDVLRVPLWRMLILEAEFRA